MKTIASVVVALSASAVDTDALNTKTSLEQQDCLAH
jgi:hypothetical protein